jgi:hypothetical protein
MNAAASKILMIRPVQFGFNEETAGSNSFQNKAVEAAEQIQQKALKEFDEFAGKLLAAGIDVEIFEDTLLPHTPDSIFPNNWISFHGNSIVLYPMLAENRRFERRQDIIDHFSDSSTQLIDLSENEQKNVFLEGTGSIVFDYTHKLAFANSSPRTNRNLLSELCFRLNYKPVTFKAVDISGADIYHTNVLMCIGKDFAVLCSECIPDAEERNMLIRAIESTGREIILISYAQMNAFAGNMYELFNEKKESIIVMSEQAYKALTKEQVAQLEKHGSILHSPLYTIEKHGGGSARCMMADVRWEYSPFTDDVVDFITDVFL